jgi:hypothetical protein
MAKEISWLRAAEIVGDECAGQRFGVWGRKPHLADIVQLEFSARPLLRPSRES